MSDSIIDKLLDGTDLRRCVTRRKFVSSICAGVARPGLVSCIESMMDPYLLLYKKYMKRKKFAMFEQARMEYIHEYFDDEKSAENHDHSPYSMWKALLENSGYPVVEEEQRIVVSSLAYEVYDKMTERVKNYKTDGMGDPGLEVATDDEAVSTLVESNVSLYRYGGFALHSLMKKYEKSNSKDEVNFLQLQVKHNEVSTLPFGIQQLQQHR